MIKIDRERIDEQIALLKASQEKLEQLCKEYADECQNNEYVSDATRDTHLQLKLAVDGIDAAIESLCDID